MFRAPICHVDWYSWECSHVRTQGSAAPSVVNSSPLPKYHPDIGRRHQHEQTPRFALMSHSHPNTSSSNNFQLIINNALKAYEKRTKQDLLAHPRASQLQTCNSPVAISAILQQQVQGLDQSRSSDDRLTKWLDPTISVLYTFSATLGEGVGLVSLRI